MSKKVDYSKLKIEYIAGDISYAKLAKKHGIAVATLSKKASKEGWHKDKVRHNQNVVEKAVRKAENEQAKVFAKELVTVGKINAVLDKALEDVMQFNKYIVQKKEKYSTPTRHDGKLLDERQWSEVETFDKIDTKALKEVAETLKLVEQMKRSMQGILSIDQQKSLEMQAQRLELEKRRVDQGETDNEVKVVFESKDAEDGGWTE
ncbi:transposase-like protein [Clostridiales Family XIII bacterium PM5-7]